MAFYKKKFKYEMNSFIDDCTVVSPATGILISAAQIQDPMFCQEMLGQTIGIIPEEDTIVCPVNGVVEVVFPTGHAFGIRRNDGSAYLVHIGIDTASLNGKGFISYLKVGQKVKAGQKAVKIALNKIRKQGYDTTVMLIITEKANENDNVQYMKNSHVKKGQIINQEVF